MDLNLKGKRALITGGTHGIGLEIATLLSKEQCHVAVCSRKQYNLDKTFETITANGVECLTCSADLLIYQERMRAIAEIKSQWDIDILVNNVGGGGRWGDENPLNTPRNVWSDVFSKNVDATIDFTLELLPNMLDKKWGRVISITSIYGSQIGGRPWFNLAKCSQSVVMRNFAKNKLFVRNGVTFNVVAPGPIFIPDTGWACEKENNTEKYNQFVESLPMGVMGSPLDVAGITVFLCSDYSKHINGSVISVDGGENVSL